MRCTSRWAVSATGHMPLGHEPAGEVVEIGSAVTGIAVGDHVVVNPMAAPSGIIGNGGASGALAEYLLIEDAVRGRSLEVVPDHIPFEVAALNEPMAVARHGVNRCATETVGQGRDLRRRPDRVGRDHRIQVRGRQQRGRRRPDSRATGEGPQGRRRRRDQLRRRGRRPATHRPARRRASRCFPARRVRTCTSTPRAHRR